MLHAFIAVLEELREFVFSGFKIPEKSKTIGVSSNTPLKDESFSLIKEPQRLLSGQKAYVAENALIAHVRPVVAFDTVVGNLQYGEEVSVLTVEGKFVLVDSVLGKVWVDNAALEYHEYDIFPRFIPGTFYFSDSTETKRVRNYLQDVASGGALHMPLHAIEYVLYKLKRKRVSVDWGGERPRMPGSWQRILKGKRGVHIGLEPKTGSVVEYYDDAQQGILGVVDAVRPNNSITISTVGAISAGEFRTDSYTQQQWRELRPVFINFS